MFRPKSKEELEADLKAYDWLRENPDKYSPLSEKDKPFFHDIFPESNQHYQPREGEGHFFSRFPDDWVPNDERAKWWGASLGIQIVQGPTFKTLRRPQDHKAYYVEKSDSPLGFEKLTEILMEAKGELESQVHVIMLRVLRYRSWEFRTPVLHDHKIFKSLVKDTLLMLAEVVRRQEKVVDVPVNAYLMALHEMRGINRLGYLKNEVAISARMATYAVEVKNGKAEKR